MSAEIIGQDVYIPVPQALTSFAKSIYSFYQNQEMVDAYLVVDNIRIGIHKAIFAAASEYFEEIFENCKQDEVELKSCSYEDAKKIIQFVYTGKFDLEDSVNNLDLISVIQDLKLTQGIELYGCILAEYIRPDNCAKFRSIAKKFKMNKLIEETQRYLREHMDLVSENDPEFLKIPFEDLAEFIEDDEMNVPEVKIYQSIIRWLKHDDSRKELAEKILEHVRYINIPKAFMVKEQKDDYVKSTNGVLDFVNQALEWYDKPVEWKRKFKDTHTYYRNYERLPENDNDID